MGFSAKNWKEKHSIMLVKGTQMIESWFIKSSQVYSFSDYLSFVLKYLKAKDKTDDSIACNLSVLIRTSWENDHILASSKGKVMNIGILLVLNYRNVKFRYEKQKGMEIILGKEVALVCFSVELK